MGEPRFWWEMMISRPGDALLAQRELPVQAERRAGLPRKDAAAAATIVEAEVLEVDCLIPPLDECV